MSSTITLPPAPHKTQSFSTALGKNVTFERVGVEGGPVGKVTGVKVFRAGTFRDSLGRQATWTAEHLQQMVFHHNLLKANGMFPNVPTREDHWSGAQGVIGYVSNLTTDGENLIADLEITEPTGADKIERGTYRGRSLEVGFFEANDESMYWPVVLGLAFVDIPAVEGLFDKDKNNGNSYFIISEAQMSGQPAATFDKGQLDWAIAAAYAQGLADAPSDKAPAMFKVQGQDTSDVAAVQAHITSLETFQAETTTNGRKSYVAQLATDGKIASTQVESLQALALTMSDAQFEAFKGTYDAAPKNSMFAQHTNNGGGTGEPKTADDEISILEETVANHRRAGLPQDQLEKTASYIKLQALKSKNS